MKALTTKVDCRDWILLLLFIGLIIQIGVIRHNGITVTITKKIPAAIRVTYYLPHALSKYTPRGGKTSSGLKVEEGHVAVSRDLYEKGYTFGKKIIVDKLGTYVIQDLTHKRIRNTVDIYSSKVTNIGAETRDTWLLEEFKIKF